MSKYKSLCMAISLFETLERAFGRDSARDAKMDTVRMDLQDIAKDVRYGGKWEGDFEVIAQILDRCANQECYKCQYKKIHDNGESCTRMLKKDAAHAIRQMAKDNGELRDIIAAAEGE